MDFMDFHGMLPTPNAREADKYTKKCNPKKPNGNSIDSNGSKRNVADSYKSMVTYQISFRQISQFGSVQITD